MEPGPPWPSPHLFAFAEFPPDAVVHGVDPEHLADRTNLGSSIGAGDTFVAGILNGLLCHAGDWGIEKTVRFAVDLATTKIQQYGFEGLASKVSPVVCTR